MSGEKPQPQGVRPPRWLNQFVKALLPRAVREDFGPDFDRLYPVNAYRNQTVASWHLSVRVAEAAAVVFCYSAAAAPGYVVAIAAITMTALTVRDAYLYHKVGFFDEKSFLPSYSSSRFYLDSAMDAVLTAILLLGSQVFIMQTAPSMAVAPGFLFKAGFLCVPLLAALRMALRPNPAAKTPFNGPDLSINAVCRWTWALNICWITAAGVTVMTGLKAIPEVLPFQRNGYAIIGFMAFAQLMRMGQNALLRDNRVRTIKDSTCDFVRAQQMLPQPLAKTDPRYPVYVSLQAFAFLLVLAPLATGLWLWLAGRTGGVNLFSVAVNLSVFLGLLMSWNFVKTTNLAASRRLQEEIDNAVTF